MTDIAHADIDQPTPEPEATEPAPSANPFADPPAPQVDQGAKTDELIDAVAPSTAHRQQRIFADEDSPFIGFDKTYTQKPLSFFSKTEFIRIVGKAIDSALSEDGVSVTQIMGMSGGGLNDLSQTDVFIRVLARLAEYAPDLLKNVFMISLNVPRHERDVVGQILESPHNNETGAGGLSDDEGFAILDTFVAQNAKALNDFFVVRLPKTVRDAQAKIAPAQTQDS